MYFPHLYVGFLLRRIVVDGRNYVNIDVLYGYGLACQPPQITGVSASPSVLWPPDHRMVTVTVNYSVTANCGLASAGISGVSSNEAVTAPGSGNTDPDWRIVDAHCVQLRAERAGPGSDRIYTITITATGSDGQTSRQDVTVTVPHDQ